MRIWNLHQERISSKVVDPEPLKYQDIPFNYVVQSVQLNIGLKEIKIDSFGGIFKED